MTTNMETGAVDTRRVAVVGLGGMGAGMAHRLLDSEFTVTVYNRTAGKAAPLVEAGAARVAEAREVAAADVIVVSLSDEAAVDQVVFEEIGPGLRPGTIIVDTSTVSPGYASRAAERLAALGARRVEACLIGNPQMARDGELRFFAAGDEADVKAVGDVLGALGRHGVLYLGPTGRASAMKLAFNLLLGAQTAALAEAVAFGEAAGLDAGLLLTAIMKSGWRSPVLDFRAEFMRTGRYEPAGFRAVLMAKDMRLAVEHATANGLALRVTESAAERFADAVTAGEGDKDASVVLETIRAHDRTQYAVRGAGK